MEEDKVQSVNHAFAMGMVALSLVFLVHVYRWLDGSGHVEVSELAAWSMTISQLILAGALVLLGVILHRKGELLAAFLFFVVGFLELSGGIALWHGYGSWDFLLLVLAVVIVVLAVLVLLQEGYLFGVGMLVIAVGYASNALAAMQSWEVLETVSGAAFLVAAVLLIYLGLAIMVNEELEDDILPIV